MESVLRKLSLVNFKTHKYSVVELSNGINVITGDNGHGKTNVLLALNWIANNRPRGTGVIRRGEDECRVTLEVERNDKLLTVEKIRSKTKNSYAIFDENGKKIFEDSSFGSSPPKEVSELLNFSDINIQKQLGPYFLVLESPGQIGRYIRSLTKLDEIDKVVKLLSSKVRGKKSEVTSLISELEDIESKVKESEKIDLDTFKSSLQTVEKEQKKLEEIKGRRDGLQRDISALEELEKNGIALPEDIDVLLEQIDTDCERVLQLSSEIEDLRSLIDRYENLESEEVYLPDNLTEIISYEEVEEQYNNIHKGIEEVLSFIESIGDMDIEIDDINGRVRILKEEEAHLMEGLRICPYCGTGLTKSAKEHLLEHSKDG